VSRRIAASVGGHAIRLPGVPPECPERLRELAPTCCRHRKPLRESAAAPFRWLSVFLR
jgi:hypothetical protein